MVYFADVPTSKQSRHLKHHSAVNTQLILPAVMSCEVWPNVDFQKSRSQYAAMTSIAVIKHHVYSENIEAVAVAHIRPWRFSNNGGHIQVDSCAKNLR